MAGATGDAVKTLQEADVPPEERLELLESAVAEYSTDDIQIYEDAKINPASDGSGYWVEAWVWLSSQEENNDAAGV